MRTFCRRYGIIFVVLFACRKAPPVLPDLGRLPEFSLIDQTGKAFGSMELTGNVWVANFIFTNCPSICPTLSQQMATLRDRAKAIEPKVHFVSITVDPANDTPQVLASYAQTFAADPARWHFLTGTHEAIAYSVRKGFRLAMEPTKGEDGQADILHSSYFVLVDDTLTIRGYYDSNTTRSMDELFSALKRLARP